MQRPPNSRVIGAGVRLLVAGATDPEPLERAFADTEVALIFARTPDGIIAAVDAIEVDAVLVLPDARGPLEVPLSELKRRHPDVPLVLDVGEPQAMLHAVRAALLLGYEDAQEYPLTEEPFESRLLGSSPPMARVREMISRAAPGNATVLVRGETGTGKELVAHAIHEASARRAGPFIPVHCAALPETLLESELFGYEKGAFTGAVARKIGRVEAASGGTLFLDEVGEISPGTQAKLLRLLQEREYQRLGGVAPIKANVRFVAATHRDLEGMVKDGSFREDLFYRLNVVPLWVPPLRARGADIELLATQFCKRFAAESGRPALHFTDAALQRIRKMRFPGNVRQLQNLVERLVVLGSGATISDADLDESLQDVSPFESLQGAPATISSEHRQGQVLPLDQAMLVAEKAAILRALKAAGQNRSKAARLLGISRAGLYNKLREHALP